MTKYLKMINTTGIRKLAKRVHLRHVLLLISGFFMVYHIELSLHYSRDFTIEDMIILKKVYFIMQKQDSLIKLFASTEEPIIPFNTPWRSFNFKRPVYSTYN